MVFAPGKGAYSLWNLLVSRKCLAPTQTMNINIGIRFVILVTTRNVSLFLVRMKVDLPDGRGMSGKVGAGLGRTVIDAVGLPKGV